jgi:hypothetical protein
MSSTVMGSRFEVTLEPDSTITEVLGLEVQDSSNSPSGDEGATLGVKE